MPKMTIYDVDPTELIEELAKELHKIEDINPPHWALFVKTGVSRERPPTREDWWYVRAASVLRKVRLKGPIGVSKLRTLYGGRKHRGYAPEVFRKGSRNIIRKIFQQLEKAGLIKQDKRGLHKGRVITPKGIKLMDNIAKKIAGNKPTKKIEIKPEVKDIPKVKEKPKESIESKTEELVRKTKEFAQGKIPTAEKLIEEVKKEDKPKKVPTTAELAEKKSAKNKNG